MNRINNKKYNYLSKSLTDIMADVDKHLPPTWFAENCPDAIRLVSNSHSRIQALKIRCMAKHIEDMGDSVFSEYFETPSYYGYGARDDESIRGLTREQAFKALSRNDISHHFAESVGMYEYYMDLDRKRFIQCIIDHMEFNTAPKDLVIKSNPKARKLEDLEWGDETIMDSAEWYRLDEFMMDNDVCYNEQSDLIWHECGGYETASLMSVIEAIDEDYHNRWSGEGEDSDCILYRLQSLHNEQPLVAMLVAKKIDEIIANTKMSWGRRYKACEDLLSKAEYDLEAAE